MTSLPKINDRVFVSTTSLTNAMGTVKFVGETKFKKGSWVGVYLDDALGNHNGTLKGVTYFRCENNHGMFVRPQSISLIKSSVNVSGSSPKHKKRMKQRFSVAFDPSSLVLGTGHKDVFDAAVDYENFNFLKILVEEDGYPVVGTDESGNTILHCIAKKGGGNKAVNVLQYVMDHGLRELLNARNINGQTCAMVAARNKKWKCLEYLVSEGADVVAKPKILGPDFEDDKKKVRAFDSVWDSCQNIAAGMDALHNGMETASIERDAGRLRVPLMPHQTSTLRSALFKSAAAGDLKYVRLLVEEYALSVNVTDREGNNVLHWIAPDPKRLLIMKYLVSQGARIHHKNKRGDTPGLVAARSRSWPVMQYLVSIGASISVKDQKNGNSIFKYAQANLVSRKALADGLAEKKRNVAAVQFEDEEPLEEEEVIEEEDEDELKKMEEDDDNDDDDEEEDDDEEDGFQNKEEVLADIEKEEDERKIKLEQAKENARSARNESAGNFSGNVYGKKKKKSKSKVCKVTVNEDCILLHYKKGSWYNRKNISDEYRWNDRMSIQKKGKDTLQVELDPDEKVSLVISPCPADSLEEFIWKHIWKSVFEGSVLEAKQLLSEYEELCNDTLIQLKQKLKDRSQLEQQRSKLRREMDKLFRKNQTKLGEEKKAQLDRILSEITPLDLQIGELVDRFLSIRQQGETLLETFSKMYEALDRRHATELEREKQFADLGNWTRAGEVAIDREKIDEQMKLVSGDRDKVQVLYEKMKQEELNYAYLTPEPDN